MSLRYHGFTTQLSAVTKLEIAEVLRSRFLLFCTLIYAGLAALFIFVALRESNILGFTGMGRVLFSFCHVLLFLLPLLGLSATAQIITQWRDNGSFEFLFSHPVSRSAYLVSTTLVRYLFLLLPLILMIGIMALSGTFFLHQSIPWGLIIKILTICSALLWCFMNLGLFISTSVNSPSKALILMLLAWAAAVFILDFGLIGFMLQWQLNPRVVFTLAALNPVQAARMALLSGVQADLATLGPVGFFLAHRIGPKLLFSIGVVWPCLLGCICWVGAFRKFHSQDII